MSVRWPLQAASISTATRAKTTITLIYLLCFGLGSYPLWTLGVRQLPSGVLICTMVEGMHYDAWNTAILAIGSLLLPGVLMCILTGLIIFSLVKSRRTRQQRLSCNTDTRKGGAASQNIEKQLTVILLSVAIAFILLRLPYTMSYTLHKWKYNLWTDPSEELKTQLSFAFKITDVIVVANYTINFFLYCLCGSAFRRQLRRLSPCRSCCQRHLASRKGPDGRKYIMTMSTSPGRSSSGQTSSRII